MPTDHLVHMGAGRQAHATCAVDALGIAYMLDIPTTISTIDPLSHRPLVIEVDRILDVRYSQPGLSVVIARVAAEGPLVTVCCPFVTFCESEATAVEFLDREQFATGLVVSVERAAAISKLIFQGVLD